METRQMPHGRAGLRFAQALVQGDYDQAYAMLSQELRRDYSPATLRQQYEFWIGHNGPVQSVEVLDNAQLGGVALDADGWAYVAIAGTGWSEAVSLTAKPLGDEYLITDLVWGRP